MTKLIYTENLTQPQQSQLICLKEFLDIVKAKQK